MNLAFSFVLNFFTHMKVKIKLIILKIIQISIKKCSFFNSSLSLTLCMSAHAREKLILSLAVIALLNSESAFSPRPSVLKKKNKGLFSFLCEINKIKLFSGFYIESQPIFAKETFS